jgi:photosystem II stability/assembly factor-like uncharacterized protein
MQHRQLHCAFVFIAGMMACSSQANPALSKDTWTQLYPQYSCGVAVDSDPGLYKTTDAGSTWNKIGNLNWGNNPFVSVDPKNPQHLYAYCGVQGMGGFWVSNDGGNNWVVPAGFDSVSKIVHSTDMYCISIDPSDFGHFILTFHSGWTNNSTPGIIEGFDGGNFFVIHNPGGWGSTGHRAFILSYPALGIGDKKTWLLGVQFGGGFWRTTDAGATWKKVYDGGYPHSAGHQMYYSKTGVLYLPSENGIARSTDNGITWQNYANTGSWYLSVCGDGQKMYTGPDGGAGTTFQVTSEADGTQWTQFSTQHFGRAPFQFAFDRANGIMYASCLDAGLWALKVTDPATNTGSRNSVAALRTAPVKSILKIKQSGVHVLTATGKFYDVKGRNIRSR